MIANQRQYRISRELREKFEREVKEIKTSPRDNQVYR